MSSRSIIERLEERRMLTTLNVVASGTQWGNSTQWIGAGEGNARFNIADITDLGINTFRIYGGMSRWEPTDDDGVYGSPSIAQIQANPNAVNWAYWDQKIKSPTGGTDCLWSASKGNAPVSADKIF